MWEFRILSLWVLWWSTKFWTLLVELILVKLILVGSHVLLIHILIMIRLLIKRALRLYPPHALVQLMLGRNIGI